MPNIKGPCPLCPYSVTTNHPMIKQFRQHLLNHYHWIWIHTQDDAPNDWFHNCIQNVSGKLMMNMLDDRVQEILND